MMPMSSNHPPAHVDQCGGVAYDTVKSHGQRCDGPHWSKPDHVDNNRKKSFGSPSIQECNDLNGQKKVWFSLDSNTEHFIPTIVEMSCQEINDRWNSKDDYYRIKRQLNAVFKLLQRGGAKLHYTNSGQTIIDGSNTSYSFRGLEFMYNDHVIGQRQNLISNTVRAILSEQNQQRIDGRHDKGRIAELSRNLTKEATCYAIFMGKLDSLAVGDDAVQDTKQDGSNNNNDNNKKQQRSHHDETYDSTLTEEDNANASCIDDWTTRTKDTKTTKKKKSRRRFFAWTRPSSRSRLDSWRSSETVVNEIKRFPKQII